MPHSEIIVHGVAGSPFVRSALLGLEEKGAAYHFAKMPMGAGVMRTPEHLVRHPFGRIPVIEHDDFTLYETQAILRYFSRVLPGPSLEPKDPRAAARMDQIANIVDWYFFPQVTVSICAERLFAQMFWNRPADETKIAAAVPQARICVKELDRLKGAAPYMAGTDVSVADLMLAPHLAYFAATPEGRQVLDGTSLPAWLERMSARDSMKVTERERLLEAA